MLSREDLRHHIYQCETRWQLPARRQGLRTPDWLSVLYVKRSCITPAGLMPHPGELIPPLPQPSNHQQRQKKPPGCLNPPLYLPLKSRNFPPRDVFLNSTEIQKCFPSEQIRISVQRCSLFPMLLPVEFSLLVAASHPDSLPCLQEELPKSVATEERHIVNNKHWSRPSWRSLGRVCAPLHCWFSCCLPQTPYCNPSLFLFICS